MLPCFPPGTFTGIVEVLHLTLTESESFLQLISTLLLTLLLLTSICNACSSESFLINGAYTNSYPDWLQLVINSSRIESPGTRLIMFKHLLKNCSCKRTVIFTFVFTFWQQTVIFFV